ncbi:START domain-containing protein [Pedobacter rhizosphaerae]|uniref:START domain-containing protein n=1 Tax=Pedobacter rhizosphaerae TaxID=390241 RepID=A0A1H9PUM8_9SPHI|nr:START domain-containing protein [Pedobacter rhizosphaerae]SER51820.1 START domain-containing protein [Pedobacter rhizosphaerae]
MLKQLAILLLFIFQHLMVYGQTDWRFSTEKDGIKVYTSILPQSKIKAVRVLCEVNASLSQITSLILDVNSGAEWVYQTKSSVLLKQVSPSELYYYSEVKLPWPLQNRDFIAHLTVTQHPKTKLVTINGPVAKDYIPEKKGIVRISESVGKWLLYPLAQNRCKIEYTLHVDPGGSIPTWLVNLFADQGPLQMIKRLRTQVQLPKYKNASISFITN